MPDMRKLGVLKKGVTGKVTQVTPASLQVIIQEKFSEPHHYPHFSDESMESGVANPLYDTFETSEENSDGTSGPTSSPTVNGKPPGTPIISRSSTANIKKNLKQSMKRLQTIQERNQHLPPHLRSSYVYEELPGLEASFCDKKVGRTDERIH